jgi:predicted AlkP superfamily phosphohydrolase/phosphomutase
VADFVHTATEVDRDMLSRFAELPADKLKEFQAQRSFSRNNKLSVLKFALMNDESFAASGLYALKKYQPDFMAFYINGLDAVEHHFWKYMEPEKFKTSIPEEEIRLYGNLIRNYYIYVDEILGRFLSLYHDRKSTILVVSDHGHEANSYYDSAGKDEIGYAKFASGDHNNAPDGILVISGKDIEKGAKLVNPSVLDIAPTLLALMGIPVGAGMPGKALNNAIGKTFLADHPVQKTSTYSFGRKYSSIPVKSGMDGVLKEKLKALGYIN